MTRFIPNELSARKAFAGTETIPGTAVTPDFRLLGTLVATEDAPLSRTEETTGGFDRLATPKRSASTFTGTYGENLTYESLAILGQYAYRRGATGVSDGAATPGYTYTKFPSFDTDDIATMTVDHGVDGLGFRNTGVRFSDWTISGDADSAEGAWQWSSSIYFRSNDKLPGSFDGVATSATATTLVMSGATWTINAWAGAYVYISFGSHVGEVRRVVSNTATTLTVDEAWDVTPTAGNVFRIAGLFVAGVPVPTYETISQYGTELYIASTFGGLGTAPAINGRIISWNVSATQGLLSKRFIDNSINEVSSRVGKTARFVTGAIRFEFDRYDEWQQWRDMTDFAIRIRQTGSVINVPTSTTHEASITIPRAVWDTYSPDERDQNLTVTMAFVAYKHATEPIFTVVSKNELATLP